MAYTRGSLGGNTDVLLGYGPCWCGRKRNARKELPRSEVCSEPGPKLASAVALQPVPVGSKTPSHEMSQEVLPGEAKDPGPL